MESVDLGRHKIRIPVAHIEGQAPGPKMVITGGMDGDEYAGIAAAYELIKKFSQKKKPFCGTLLVIPIVNIPGWKNRSSFNPDDGLYPKRLFPGTSGGKPTERLVSWLAETALAKADAWMDLHSAPLHEGIQPFLWTYETGEARISKLNRSLLEQSGAAFAVCEPASASAPAERNAASRCWYVLAESGARGEANPADVARHVYWAEKMMAVLGMTQQEKPAAPFPTLLRSVTYLRAKEDGVWNLARPFSPHLSQGQPLG